MKLCECGCGEPAPIAKEAGGGYKKGEPKRFVAHHHRRGADFSSEHRANLSKAMLGKKKSPEHVAKMSRNMRGKYVGETHPNWTGDDVGYFGIHGWLARKHPKSGVCENCLRLAKTDYSLIHGREYSRDRNDYRELCRRCHRRYDGKGHPPTQFGNPAPPRLAGDMGVAA